MTSNEFVLGLLKTSLLLSPVIALLLTLVPLLQRRYRANWRYAAWLVLSVRLLMPVTVSLPQPPVTVELPARFEMAGQADTGEILPPVQPENPHVEAAARLSPARVLFTVWAVGAVLFLSVQVGSYQLFLHRLHRGADPAVPEAIRSRLARQGAALHIRRLPGIAVRAAVEAPVLLGVFRPRILLPHTAYSEDEMDDILRHELLHYRRRDIWYKTVLLAAHTMHWFNPLVYLMAVQAGKDIELCCDNDVVKGLDNDARARYARTILSALPRAKGPRPAFSTQFAGAKNNMKTRLRNLFEGSSKHRGIAALCAVLACVATAGGMVSFVFAADSAGTAVLAQGDRIEIPALSPGQIVCVGKVEVDPGQESLVGSLAAENGSGLFAVQSPTPGLVGIPEEQWWVRHFAERDDGVVSFFLSGLSENETATYYLYVGSEGTDLVNIRGSLDGNAPATQASLTVSALGEGRNKLARPTEPSDMAVMRLGLHTLEDFDALRTSVQWSGDGQVMLIYTDADYNADELLAPLQGIPGLPEPDYANIDDSKYGNVFNFRIAASAPLEWDYPVPAPGAHYFYLVTMGDTGNLRGSVVIAGKNGENRTLWSA